ncbi:peptidase M14 carboxypeptidase A [Gemmatirosa kalamazoonensis]|uniref:Peptidase M14 carboxypeptidase A n=1 Tax=Gemmatirosa kalamazoonensis TaxID=861299 RepID=W0REN1_9BACT|nr:M14 metallopeptidase family protein [Gemmatirosa kalamazoonensis]AHG89236.1 peptidase M14 carboxypeptidase A [Gemmatirosa kalamazoonensis]
MLQARSCRALGAALLLVAAPLATPLAATAQPSAARHITTPKEAFGFNVGDDYRLATYTQFEKYWRTIAAQSDRAKLVEIGKTEEGRPQLMMIVSSPANLARLDRYKEISRRLALGLARDSSEARALAREGKAVVWIDGGLHATEVLGAHQLIETSYHLLSRTDPETMRFLNDCIILLVHVNPDGMELVSNWYMKDADSTKRGMNIPRLYEKYAGHDDNRDFYMANLKETQNDNKVMYWEWFPQIVYNHHQTGPVGTVMFAPPFRDPFNYNYDPLVVMELDQVGSAMHSRFEAEGKPGVTMRSGSTYSTWWNGGLRTMPYFHNMVGLLTETIGNPTPQTIPFVPEQQLPRADLPYPIAPQAWHFRQSIDYSITANRAVLDLASRQKENFLFNIWRMARNSIERGSRDTWTTTPSELDSVKQIAAANAPPRQGGPVGDALGGGRPVPTELFTKFLRDPAKRDPRGYVIPSDQPDFPTAVRFVNALRYGGVTVLQATAPFTVNGKQYPANSFVVKAAQPFRPHVLDMFEPQDHPNDFAYPGGPPKRPYDNAGYTLAYQMGVQFDRILDGFDVPNAVEVKGLATVPAARVAAAPNASGFLVSHAMNNAFIAVNKALKAGADVYMLRSPLSANGKTYPAGTFWIASANGTPAMLQELARSQGVAFDAAAARPAADAQKLTPKRIALFDQYGGSMPSGWTRYLFEQYDFPFQLVYPKDLDAGNLAAKYDVIVFPSGTVPGVGGGRGGRGGGGFGGESDTTTIPAEFRARLGRVTPERTVPQIRKFLEDGGTVVAVGTSTALGYHLGLPLENALVESMANGTRELPAEKFYIPGSILRAAVDTTRPVSYGIGTGGEVDVFYDNSPAFRLKSDAAAQGVRPLAWFASASPLRSGWAWGQSYLNGAVAAAEAKVGKGTLYLFAPEITFRAQPYGTFKWLFNGIYTPTAPNAAM